MGDHAVDQIEDARAVEEELVGCGDEIASAFEKMSHGADARLVGLERLCEGAQRGRVEPGLAQLLGDRVGDGAFVVVEP